MPESISLWIRQIILVVMFATFMDFLMPDNGLLKYIKVLLGLIVMMSILNPLLILLHRDYSLGEVQLKLNDLVNEQEIMDRAARFRDSNDELLFKQYVDNVRFYVKKQIEQNSPFEVKDVEIEMVEDRNNRDFGKIATLRVLLRRRSGDDKAGWKRISVEVGNIKKGAKREAPPGDAINELTKLKEYIKSQFDVPEKNIFLELEG
ncbi:stage III sporulation protein AF [Thermoanaerobacterium sp. DL9XJH110]|uniref:stage III sporulation protein AF n=1 Tax=Thermoanaerobacterium sp. DL9XJH110 TaxID=3386643 RepID=UPI003BB4BEDB